MVAQGISLQGRASASQLANSYGLTLGYALRSGQRVGQNKSFDDELGSVLASITKLTGTGPSRTKIATANATGPSELRGVTDKLKTSIANIRDLVSKKQDLEAKGASSGVVQDALTKEISNFQSILGSDTFKKIASRIDELVGIFDPANSDARKNPEELGKDLRSLVGGKIVDALSDQDTSFISNLSSAIKELSATPLTTNDLSRDTLSRVASLVTELDANEAGDVLVRKSEPVAKGLVKGLLEITDKVIALIRKKAEKNNAADSAIDKELVALGDEFRGLVSSSNFEQVQKTLSAVSQSLGRNSATYAQVASQFGNQSAVISNGFLNLIRSYHTDEVKNFVGTFGGLAQTTIDASTSLVTATSLRERLQGLFKIVDDPEGIRKARAEDDSGPLSPSPAALRSLKTALVSQSTQGLLERIKIENDDASKAQAPLNPFRVRDLLFADGPVEQAAKSVVRSGQQ